MQKMEVTIMTKLDIIILVSAYWKFDDNQQPMSSWHDKQYLLRRLESDLDEMIKSEFGKFRDYWNADGTYDRIIILEEDIESYLNQAK